MSTQVCRSDVSYRHKSIHHSSNSQNSVYQSDKAFPFYLIFLSITKKHNYLFITKSLFDLLYASTDTYHRSYISPINKKIPFPLVTPDRKGETQTNNNIKQNYHDSHQNNPAFLTSSKSLLVRKKALNEFNVYFIRSFSSASKQNRERRKIRKVLSVNSKKYSSRTYFFRQFLISVTI